MNWQAFLDFLATIYPPNTVLTRALHFQLFEAMAKYFASGGAGLDVQELPVTPGSADSQLVSTQAVALDFVGYIDVRRNGTSVPTWRGLGDPATYPAYFCIGPSSTPRKNGQVKQGDVLRWNSSIGGPLVDGDLITLQAAIGVPSVSDPSAVPAAFATADDQATLDAASSGQYPRWILFDNGADAPIVYAFSPRYGRIEIFSFPPTTPINSNL